MKLSVRHCGVPFSCNLNDLVKSLGENLEKFDFFKLKSKPQLRKKTLENFVRLLSMEVKEGNKDPVECSFHQVKQRPTRSFKEEEKIQILKQLSSQLYYRFMSLENTDISEVQVLRVSKENKTRYLFFATNPLEKKKNFKAIKKEWKDNNLQDLVTVEYQPHGVDSDEIFRRAERSKRHAKKLKQRVFSDKTSDELVHFIRTNNGKGKIFSSQPDSLPDYGIYFVNPYKVKSKNDYEIHAEEQLCNIVQLIRKDLANGEWYFNIFGKKRPCSSCFGRLCHESKENNDLSFSKYPGYLWIPALLEQERNVQLSTLRYFILSPSYVSKNPCEEQSTSVGTLSQSSVESNIDEEDSNITLEQNELLDGIENVEIILREEDWKVYRRTIQEEEYNQSDSNSEMEELINDFVGSVKF